MAGAATVVLRGPALTFTGDPFVSGIEHTMVHERDAMVVVEDGRIVRFGPAEAVAPGLPAGAVVHRYADDSLIVPGFVDCHVHYPQTPMIGACGEQLLDWLQRYTFPTEQAFADPDHARAVARIFLRETLRNGVTTACVYCTVHPHSVDALFEEAARLGMRIAAGKVLMDRNAPAALSDTAQSGYDQSKALIARWHGHGRLLYAVTPRFALTSTPAQLAAAGALWREHPGCLMQTHLSETRDEVAEVRRVFPERRHYLDVYDHHGLCGPRAVFGHGVWLEDAELDRLAACDAAVAHCPTSNAFLGSGPFDLWRAAGRSVRVGLGTDLGAGTSFSILATLGAAYEAAQAHRRSLPGPLGLYLATRGSARALHLEDRIGSLAPGNEADLAVLDMRSTPLIAFRMDQARDLAEQLFVQMVLADDRAVRETWVAGHPVWRRGDDAPRPPAQTSRR